MEYTRDGASSSLIIVTVLYHFHPRHPRDLLIPILDTALDIPYISIRVIIAFERASRKPRRSSYLPANYYEAFASHMLLPSHIPIRIFRINDSIREKLRVNWRRIYTTCSNLPHLRLRTYVHFDVQHLDFDIGIPTIFWWTQDYNETKGGINIIVCWIKICIVLIYFLSVA